MSVDKEWGGHRSESGSPSCQHQTALPSLFYEIWLGGREIVKFTKEIVRQTTQSKEMDYRDAVGKSLQCHFVTTVVNFHQNYLPNQHFFIEAHLCLILCRDRAYFVMKAQSCLGSLFFSVSEQELMQKVLFGNQKFSLSFSLFFRHTRQILSTSDLGEVVLVGRLASVSFYYLEHESRFKCWPLADPGSHSVWGKTT